MPNLARPSAEGFVAKPGEGVELYATVCPLLKRLQQLYGCQPVEPVHVQQRGDPRLH